MRYPNLRYGNPEEMRYYTKGVPIDEICRNLKRSKKSVQAWLNGDRKVPWWVPELLRLQHMEHRNRMREMGIGEFRRKLGLSEADVIQINSNRHSLSSVSFGTPAEQPSQRPLRSLKAVA